MTEKTQSIVWRALCAVGMSLAITATALIVPGVGIAQAQGYSARPNILYIIVDDLNDYSPALDGYIGVAGSGHPQARTPNIERFLNSIETTNFLSAYTPVPACKGARTAIMSGVSPGKSGVVSNYSQSIWLNPDYEDVLYMHDYFRVGGYTTFRSGKVEHGTEVRNPALFDLLRAQGKSIPEAFNGSFTSWDQVVTKIGLDNEYKKKAAAAGYDIVIATDQGELAEFKWASLDLDEKIWPDYKITSAAIKFLESRAKSDDGKPFFLAHGIEKPHLPWYCPKKYFDEIASSSDSIITPVYFPGDLDDVGPIARNWAFDPSNPQDFSTYIDQGGPAFKKQAVHSYLACSAFADAQFGRLMKALKDNGFEDNTVVVLASDHGFMLGEKNSWGKLRLWEESLRVPFGIRVPQQYLGFVPPRSQYIYPVSIGSIYATLAELAFGDKIQSDYSSLVPLINSATTDSWVAENVESFYGHVNNVTLRRPVYRYTVYQDGFEELYDLRNDQGEHVNVANVPGYQDKRQESCALLKEKAPGVAC